MKTIGRRVLYLLAAVTLLTACNDEKVYRIGVSQCGAGQWREKVNNEMLAAQHLYDETAQVIIACAYDDTERQIRQIDSLVSSGIDLLVVAPNETNQLADVIANVRKKGIPVIYFDRKATTDDYTAFIGGSNVEAGRTMGEYALSLGGGFVMEITGAMSTSPAQERHEGFSKVMVAHPELKYVCKQADWTSDEACRIVEEQIKTGEVPDIVFCHNDGMATGVYKAVVEQNIEGRIKIIGIDGLPGEGIEYVQFGHQVGTYVYPTHGDKIVKLALDILTGHPYERENALKGILVTPENVNLVDLNSREMMAQNKDLIIVQDKLEQYFGWYNVQRKMLVGSVITIIVLMMAIAMVWRAYLQTRKTICQRQSMNEEQLLFYTDANRRKEVEIFSTPQEKLPAPKKQDTLFAEQLNEAIRKNMSNPNLKMEELGEEMGLGRVQLYRKVKAITGVTPVELLRKMRLQEAYVLLGSTTKTVAEIAFEVGFNTPGYFSKCFKEEYGKLPGEIREK
jgi:ABC-type sugar transport system substrate-binding protein/AraC-like DNA-binding protein